MGLLKTTNPSKTSKKLHKMHSDSHWDSSISDKPFAVPRKVLDHLKAAAYMVGKRCLCSFCL